MSTPDKLRPSEIELTKLKVLWRDSLSEDAKGFWRSLFISADSTQAQIRQQITTRLKINLRHDSQLNAFRDWEMEQRESDIEAERQEEDERRLKEQFGDWTLDQVREEVLKRSYARAIREGDWGAGRKTIVQDLNVKKVQLDERKLVLLERKAAAFDQLKDMREKQRDPSAGLSDAERMKIVDKVDEILGIKK